MSNIYKKFDLTYDMREILDNPGVWIELEYDENSDKSTHSVKDIIMIIFSLFLIGFIGVMLLISIFNA